MGLFDFLKKKKDEDLDDLGDLGDLGGNLGPEPAFPERGTSSQAPMGMPGVPEGKAFGQTPPTGTAGRDQLFTQQAPPPPLGTPQPQMQSQQPGPQTRDSGNIRAIADMLRNKMDTISTRLDSLRASVDRINDRIQYIERYLIGKR